MSREFKLELPLPPSALSPNKKGTHWGPRASATRKYRETCGYFALSQIGRRRAKGMITIDFEFYLCRTSFTAFSAGLYFPKDRTNALESAKAAIDSLQDCGLIKADTKKYVNIGTVNLWTTKKEHQGQTKLVMTIRETNGDDKKER